MASKTCSYYLLIWINIAAVAAALAILGITLNVMFGTGFGLVSLAGMPVQVYYAAIAFSVLVFLIGVLGIIGAYRHSKTATYLFVFLDLLTAILVIVVLVFALLYSNGISTSPVIDNSVVTLSHDLEDGLLNQALNLSSVWVVTQSKLGCCGIDLAATYRFSDFNMTDSDFQLLLQPNASCDGVRQEVLNLHKTFPNWTAEAEGNATSDPKLVPKFCKTVVESFIHTNTYEVAGIAIGIVILQLITVICAFKLLCKIYTTHGGFVIPPEPSGGALAYGKGQPQVGFSGGALA